MIKKKIETSKAKVTHKLTVHGLLGALSYWGTSARLLLVGVLILFAYFMNISVASYWQYFDRETIFLIYGIGTILVLDFGYVMTARALPINKMFDRWVVMMSDLLVASFFVIPSLFYVVDSSDALRVLSFIVALLVLALRILLGLLFTKRR